MQLLNAVGIPRLQAREDVNWMVYVNGPLVWSCKSWGKTLMKL
jgi:hypothetical protein